jgi:hypothetical protein
MDVPFPAEPFRRSSRHDLYETRGKGPACIEVHVFDVFNAGAAEAPVVEDLAYGVSNTGVIGVRVEDRRGHDENPLLVQQRDASVHVTVPAAEVRPNAKSNV